ncbi:MAG: hypothetical protein MJZ38_01050 [archaeon]|nr:hypothetical protein [archaeon]
MPEQGYSDRFIVLFNPEVGTRTIMNPYAVDICCSVNESDKTVSELSEELGLPTTTVQGIVTRMFMDGLLIRFEDRQDFRKTRYHPVCNTLVTDSIFFQPVMEDWRVSGGPLEDYTRYRSLGVDIWDVFSYVGLKLEYRTDELIHPPLDYCSVRQDGCRTGADRESPVDIAWEGPYVLKQDFPGEPDPECIFRQAILSCSLIKAIRNNTEKHFQYRPRLYRGASGRTVSIFYNPFETMLAVDGQTQYIMRSDYQDDARRKVVFSLEGHSFIFANSLMIEILETLCERECDIRELIEVLGRQKMTVNNALGKLMEIGFVTLKDPLKKRGRIYRTGCVKVLEINPVLVNEGFDAESELFWSSVDVSDFDAYVRNASSRVLKTAGISLF